MKGTIQMNDYMTISQAATYLNVRQETLRRWEKLGKIQPYRTNGNQRRYTKEMLDAVLNGDHQQTNVNQKLTIGYCRVSSNNQQEDLNRQIHVVQTYCENQGKPFRIIKDQGSGLNYKRPGFQKLIKAICHQECDKIVINYQDRLARFGFDLIRLICQEHHVELIVLNQTQIEDPNQELVEDVLSLITVFSAKLYGRRSHKNVKIVKTNEELFTKNS